MREKEKCRKGNVQYFCMYTAGFLAAALIITDLCKGTCIFYQNGGRCGTALCSADVDP